MKYHKAFENVIGQTIAKTRMTESILSGQAGKEMLSPLFMGEAGKGKTHIMKATLRALEENGFDVLWFNSPEEFRAAGEHYDSFVNLITRSEHFAIGIDEVHLLNHKATIRMDKVKNFLMKALDKNNQNQNIRFDDNLTVNFDRTKGCFLLGTNFPEQLDKSGAFQSRCDSIVLDDYSENELVDILQFMLTRVKFQPANEGTLKMIARCGRGTARPLEHIVEQLKISANANGGKTTINKDDVLRALKLSKMYPLGVQPWEISILERTRMAVRDNVLTQMIPNIEPRTYNRGKGYLISKEFAAPTPQGLQRTDKGTRYLETIKKEGFKVAI